MNSLGEVDVKGENQYIVFENVDIQAAWITVNIEISFERNISGELYVFRYQTQKSKISV